MTTMFAIACAAALFLLILLWQTETRRRFARTIRARAIVQQQQEDARNKRKHERRYVAGVRVEVYDPILQHTTEAELRDCSAHGMGIISDGLLAQGRVLLLALDDMRIPVRVRHSSRVQGIHVTGLEIVDDPPQGWVTFVSECLT